MLERPNTDWLSIDKYHTIIEHHISSLYMYAANTPCILLQYIYMDMDSSGMSPAKDNESAPREADA
jgi:hypothetical protein